MPNFQYKGRNQRGEPVNGRLEAATADAVATQLFNTGVTPIDIVEANSSQDVFSALNFKFGQSVKLEEIILFCRQMYTLLKAGVPILRALKGLRESVQNPTMANMIGDLGDTLDAGLDLTSALKRHPDIFSSLFVSLVQVGEATGRLDGAFLQLAKYLELEQDTRNRIKAAVRYPIFVFATIAIAIGIINVWVIPAFTRIYATFHAKLPILTRFLIATSNFSIHYGYLIIASMVMTAFSLRAYINSPIGRYNWHKLKLKIPIIGSILYRATLARFARSLSVTLKSGVPLVQGLTIVSRAVDNEFIGARIMQMRDGVERGETINRTAAATGMFPPLVIQMIAVGEETGAVDDLMNDVADYYEREVDYDLKNLSSAIEPILIIIAAVMVLVLALGVFLPMWDLARAAKGGG